MVSYMYIFISRYKLLSVVRVDTGSEQSIIDSLQILVRTVSRVLLLHAE